MKRTNKWIDISLELSTNLPIWPDSVGFSCTKTMSLDKDDSANVSHLDCDVHVGTHIEAPLHFLKNGFPVDEIGLDTLIGEAMVVHLPNIKQIGKKELNGLRIPDSTKRLLLRTDNSELLA